MSKYYLLNGTVTPFGVGKPDKAKRLAECDEKGNNIADVAAIEAEYAAREQQKLSRNPIPTSNPKRFYRKDGQVVPFGLGKPGIEKLSNECTKDGTPIDNSALVATMRQPGGGGGNGGSAGKIAGLESQLAALTAMMQQLLAGGAVPVPVQAVQAVPEPEPVKITPAAVEQAQVEPLPAQVVEPVKVAAATPAEPTKSTKGKGKGKGKKVVDEDPYETFVNNAADLSDPEPIAFDSSGFVVTDLD